MRRVRNYLIALAIGLGLAVVMRNQFKTSTQNGMLAERAASLSAAMGR